MKKRNLFLLLSACVIAGGILRIAGSMGPLWLDETWSLLLLRQVHTIPEIFTNIHFDNNHYLNSVYLFWLGPYRTPFLYRIPALLAGISLLILLPLRSIRKNRPQEAIIVSLLLCFSFLLIDESGQARGYMPMLLCGYLATECLEYYCAKKRALCAFLFGCSALLAVCWHVTFFEWYAILVVYSFVLLFRQKESLHTLIRHLLMLHTLPLIGMSLLVWFDLRFLHIGFLMTAPAGIKALQIVASIFSLEMQSKLTLFCLAVFCVAILLWMMKTYMRIGSEKQQLYIALAILGSVPLCMIQTGAAPRHFFPLTFLFLLCLAHMLWRWWQGERWQRVGVLCLIGLYLCGNILQTIRLYQYGRGEALPALTYIAAHDSSDPITIFSENPPLVSNLLEYYWPLLHVQRHIRVENAKDAAIAPPLWFFSADDPYRMVAKASSFSVYGAHYVEVKEPFQARSYWRVYKRTENSNQTIKQL